ncbi:Acetylcholine receptor subunit alpha-like [Melipona quadrifasciata]|uniref:Acetylcholine receptor subunit alpha-like n=1 Tax=Melipona quadrifasciata TaxID=166423 RepID=A0A0M9ADM9_9HYME|nr:Acetylcholine receptor subunit alpha-like [Melipona quadrifasciata]
MPPIIGETLRVWFLSALVVHGAVAGNPDAKRLYDDLLSNYNKLVRPVVNTSDVLRVCIKLKLSQLIDVVSRTVYSICFACTVISLFADNRKASYNL